MEQLIKQLKELDEKICNTKTLTTEEFIEVDNELMELQMQGLNEVFEKLREKLSIIEIKEIEIEVEGVEEDEILDDEGNVIVQEKVYPKPITDVLIKMFTVEELVDNYTVKEAKTFAKENNIKGYSKFKEAELWAWLKEQI